MKRSSKSLLLLARQRGQGLVHLVETFQLLQAFQRRADGGEALQLAIVQVDAAVDEAVLADLVARAVQVDVFQDQEQEALGVAYPLR